jgi:muramoyltetrapeptide carboxypeptidase LdcA involved in peptidoglycan recycling
MHWRYEIARRRLESLFQLNVVEASASQRGREYVYNHPQARAEDLMEALQNDAIAAIFLNQGGDDGIRILPYVDMRIISDHPKIFMGYSDGTTFTSMFYKAGIVSFYGPNVLTTLSEPVQLHPYTEGWIRRILFSSETIGPVEPANEWTAEQIDWSSRTETPRRMLPGRGYELLQGTGRASGRLMGGCLGPLQVMMGTSLWPQRSEWKDSIVFLEGMFPYANELAGLHALRALAAAGVFEEANAIVYARPTALVEECKRSILKVVRDEQGLSRLPILFNVDCGHTAPMAVMPLGIRAEIDCEKAKFRIPESAVR